MYERERGFKKHNTTKTIINEPLYLCNFQVAVDGEWLCLKEMENIEKLKAVEVDKDMDTIKKSKNNSVPTTPQFEQIIQYPDYPLGKRERNPALIERNNLVNIFQLLIKEVIDSSIKFGCQLDSDHIPLQHFFIILEHILKHGIKSKKVLLGPKKELWDLLQSIENKGLDVIDITATVKDLPTVKTSMGRARAWLRLAMIKKKLADLVEYLIQGDHNLLNEYYDPNALLRSEEASVIAGFLVSLNVVDCNICLKEEHLDDQENVIDFSLYLKNNKDTDGSLDNPIVNGKLESPIAANNLKAILDQKSYIEEMNRHLSSTVTNLESKVEGLRTTNELMKEDLNISQKALIKAQTENKKLVNQIENMSIDDKICPSSTMNLKNIEGGGGNSLLNEVILQRDSVKKELDLQISMKEEMEIAMKLLEKDVHAKQDTINNLENQLEDIKQINIDMYCKLEECENEIVQKGMMVAKLEAKTQDIGRMLSQLQK